MYRQCFLLIDSDNDKHHVVPNLTEDKRDTEVLHCGANISNRNYSREVVKRVDFFLFLYLKKGKER